MILKCSRIKDSCNVPLNLKILFEENSKNLNELQRNIFAEFLNDIVNVCCNIFHNKILTVF